MALRRYISVIAAVIFLFGLSAAAASGSPGDPVISLSYIKEKFIPQIMKEADTRSAGVFDATYQNGISKLAAVSANLSVSSDRDRIAKYIEYIGYMRTMNSGVYSRCDSLTPHTLKQGERLVVTQGSSFTVTSGTAKIEGPAKAELINSSSGVTAEINSTAAERARYILASDSIISVRAESASVVIAVQGSYQVLPAYTETNMDYALVLKELGLFIGSGKGFELERQATRLEALIMFIRLIGEESEALGHTAVHPFSDVPKWGGELADKYVAYAYDKGYTNGTSANKFSPSLPVTAEQYMTFVLRAMGYRDGEDFSWNDALTKAVQLGILTAYERDMIYRGGFYRDTVVYVSYYALMSKPRDSGATLLKYLEGKGIISAEKSEAALNAARLGRK
ncbi:MAG: S-layer homology domain-containing protein [Oscillospiraceae bacterium]|nr:S-layer homology domain-containing protein [Oscillospiraceae bacterium]